MPAREKMMFLPSSLFKKGKIILRKVIITLLLVSSIEVVASSKKVDAWLVEMLDRVNKERKTAGVRLLCLNEKLIKAAKKHNKDMVENNFSGHVGSDGSSIGDRITREDYKYGNFGENIAKGQESVTKVMNAFMNSPVHKDNILFNRFKHIGAAWDTEKRQWTQVFAAAKEGVEFCMDYKVVTSKPTKKPKPTKNYDKYKKVGRCNKPHREITKKAKNADQCYKKCSNEKYKFVEFIKKGSKRTCNCQIKCPCMDDVKNKYRTTIFPKNYKIPDQCS